MEFRTGKETEEKTTGANDAADREVRDEEARLSAAIQKIFCLEHHPLNLELSFCNRNISVRLQRH